MQDQTWDRVKKLFHDALALPEEERGSFLSESCAEDPVVRAEVEDLLAAHERVPEEAPPSTGASGAVGGTEGPGTVIGRYKLLELIGEGGFGTVYMAEQEEPVHRRVALKIIKPGMDTRQVIARFEAERQALAMMQHPNIATVLDAGATAAGRPYFVMELVRGLPLTEYCDDYGLSVRERLELFVQVCGAVQHAHHKGVIHRDLKPSNVLVTRHDGEPVPKVIDFGVAKATHLRLTEKTMFTGYGQFIGTPAYMSPEQAELSGLDVDTRTDIYSLGVLLYELLTGTTPFDARRLGRMALLAMQHVIREEEPPRPSTRLSTLGDSLAEVARRRRAEPSALPKLVRGELDWIVMKALEKDRRRRYDSASELGAEIVRLFNHEPVSAGPPSTAYQLRKLLARHRRTAGAAAAIVTSVMLMGSLSIWLGWRATRAAERARAGAVLANAAATDDPLLKAQLTLELSGLPEVPGRLAIAREAANHAIPIAVYRGHARTLTGAAFSSDGTRMVTTGRDGVAIIRTLDGSQEPVVLSGYHFGVDQPAFSPEGDLVAASSNGGLHVWPTGGGDPVVLESARSRFAFSPDGSFLLTGGEDNSAQLWEVGTWTDPRALTGHAGVVTDAAFNPAGTLLATASTDGTIRVARPDALGEPIVLRGHAGPVRSLDFSADGQLLVTASDDGTSRIWPIDAAGPTAILSDRDRASVTRAEFIDLYGTDLVLTVSEDGLARVWGVEREGAVIVDYTSGVEDGVLSANGQIALTRGEDDASIWRVDGSGPPIALLGHEFGIHGVALSPDGTLAATVGEDEVRVWRTDVAGEALTIGTPAHMVETAAFSPDGSRFAAGFADGSVRVGSVDAKAPGAALQGHEGAIRSVAFSPDGERLVTASEDGTARLWYLSGNSPPVVLQGHEGPVTDAAFSPDMTRVATTSDDGAVRLWAGQGRGQPMILSAAAAGGMPSPVSGVQFSPDGGYLLAVRPASPEPVALVWRLAEPDDAMAFPAAEQIEDARLSPDGKLLAVASTDGTATVWRIDAPGEPMVLRGHLDEVLSVGFGPNSSTIVTSSTDGSARLWSAEDGREIAAMRAGPVVSAASFSPDGSNVVTATSSDIVARVWPTGGNADPLVLSGHPWESGRRFAFEATFSGGGTHVMTVGGGFARIWRVTWPALLAYLRENVAVCLSAEQRMRHLAEAPADATTAHAACEGERRIGTAG